MKKFCFGILAVTVMVLCMPADALAGKRVKNVIYMIGDGMGLTHLTAAMIENGGPMAVQRAQYVGLQTTHSDNNEVTDSAAAGTALATGTKTYNGAIGVDSDRQPVESVLEKSKKSGRSTGMAATYSITHATPASFIAHVPDRGMEYDIAEYIYESDIDVFIGGGRQFFEKREDGRNLSNELKDKGYSIVYSIDDVMEASDGKLGALLAENAMPVMTAGRGTMLPDATAKALELLSGNKKGFFLMVEGSQIDGGGHDNNGEKVVRETHDFDAAVKVAFDFADRNPGTLVVVTADHETGGMSLPEKSRKAVHAFSTGGHTATMVPIYAYGAGAENFTGIMDNIDIPNKIEALMGLE